MMSKWRRQVSKNWMLVGLGLAIPLAERSPWIGAKGGPLRPEVTVKYGCVALIFFLSGIALQPKQVYSAASNGKLHLFIQGFTMALVPFVTRVVAAPCLRLASVENQIVDGIIAVSCLPPPVSSAVILTKAVGGNEAAAILNSALGSLLGVFATPLLLVASIETQSSNNKASSTAVLLNVLKQLASTVLLPLILGQLARPKFERIYDRYKKECSIIGQATLLLIIYTTFCDSFSLSDTNKTTLSSLLFLVLLIVAMQASLMASAFFMADKLFRDPQDVVCAVFCATHKSLTLGVPVMRLVFADNPNLPLLTVPLLIYHPAQILLGGIVTPAFKAWLRRREAPEKDNDNFFADIVKTVVTKAAPDSSSQKKHSLLALSLLALDDTSSEQKKKNVTSSDGAVTRRTRLVVEQHGGAQQQRPAVQHGGDNDLEAPTPTNSKKPTNGHHKSFFPSPAAAPPAPTQHKPPPGGQLLPGVTNGEDDLAFATPQLVSV